MTDFQFLSEMGDVDIDEALGGTELAAAKIGCELVARDHAASGVHEDVQDIELDGGDFDTESASPDLAAAGIETDLADFDRTGSGGRRLAGAAQHGANPRQQLMRREG